MNQIDVSKLSREIKDKYQVIDNTFLSTVKNDPRDKIEIEIGDSKQPDFKPQLKIKRWDNEVNLSVRLIDDKNNIKNPNIYSDDKAVIWKRDNLKIEFIDTPPTPDDEGNHKFIWYLKSKPTSNVVKFSIQTKGLDFFYQEPIILADGQIRIGDIFGLIDKKTFSSLVDLGGGTGELAKKYNGTCVDMSQEAYDLKVTNNYIQADLLDGLPMIDDKQFDLVTGIGFLKYIPEDKVGQAIKTIARIGNRGFFTLDKGFRSFSDTPLIVNNNNRDWWLAQFTQFAPGFEVEIFDLYWGVDRPENVMGSYAVYHKTKGGFNDISGKDYKTGKFCHIYRPHLIDAVGNEAWGELHIDIDKNLYEVTIPQEFLDNAVYPIKSNDTFGYSSSGASTIDGQGLCQNFYGQASRASGSIASASGAFTPTAIKFYIERTNSQPSVDTKGALYSISGTTGTLISDTETASGATTATGLQTRNITGASEKSAGNYGIMAIGDATDVASNAYGPTLAGDTATNTDQCTKGLDASTYTLPATKGFTTDNFICSIYVEYTAGGASSEIKSVNALAKASVKSVNGLAIASVKSINGLA